MADTKQRRGGAAPAQPDVPELCGNCEHFLAHAANPSFGPCRLSGKTLPAPIVVTDRGSCTAWVLAKRLKG